MIYTDYLPLRHKDTGEPLEGVTAQLLPVGSSYPSGAIALTANPSIPHHYDFNGSVNNGAYYLYVDSSLVLRNTSNAWVIHVIRDAIITPEDTDFAVSV